MTAFCLLLTSWLCKRFWQEIYAFEALSCLSETLNCKNFGKTLFFLQDILVSDKNLSREEVKALNNLVKNKDLVIKKADKGNNIIALNRSDYISKLSEILEDTSKFRIVNKSFESLNSYGRTNNTQKFRRSR